MAALTPAGKRSHSGTMTPTRRMPTKIELTEELAFQQSLVDAIESAALSLPTDELRRWGLRASIFNDQIEPHVGAVIRAAGERKGVRQLFLLLTIFRAVERLSDPGFAPRGQQLRSTVARLVGRADS
jgi:hypothetical protein